MNLAATAFVALTQNLRSSWSPAQQSSSTSAKGSSSLAQHHRRSLSPGSMERLLLPENHLRWAPPPPPRQRPGQHPPVGGSDDDDQEGVELGVDASTTGGEKNTRKLDRAGVERRAQQLSDSATNGGADARSSSPSVAAADDPSQRTKSLELKLASAMLARGVSNTPEGGAPRWAPLERFINGSSASSASFGGVSGGDVATAAESDDSGSALRRRPKVRASVDLGTLEVSSLSHSSQKEDNLLALTSYFYIFRAPARCRPRTPPYPDRAFSGSTFQKSRDQPQTIHFVNKRLKFCK